jgi:enamine deaminase RidA (YjgF/YER057c/UK114 family)
MSIWAGAERKSVFELHALARDTGRVSDGNSVSARVVAGKATPRGAYPHLRVAGDLVWVSGTSSRRADDTFIGVDISDDGSIHLDVAAQTRAVIENIRDLLATEGLDLRHLVQVTSYLVDMADFEKYNAAYAEYFDHSGPTRTTVAVRDLPHPHLLIEITAVAHRSAADVGGSHG